jgi:tetratricopeptide (TPR) repeat protein
MVFTLVMLASSAPSAWAATSEADALAMTGQEYLAKGRVEKAKDCFFKALFHDEDCPIALYELSKIFQQEQNTAAASDFYTRSIHQMENRLSSHPDYESKISDAKTRLQAVNPYAGLFSIAMEDYAQDLGWIVKMSIDTLTNEEVSNRVTV